MFSKSWAGGGPPLRRAACVAKLFRIWNGAPPLRRSYWSSGDTKLYR